MKFSVSKTWCVALMLSALCASAMAADSPKGLEDALQAALQSKRGITVYVNGQTVGGAVTRVEPGSLIELRNQEFGRIVIRWDRIDGIAMP